MTSYDEAINYDAQLSYNGDVTPPAPSGGGTLPRYATTRATDFPLRPNRRIRYDLLREDEEIIIL